MVQEILDIRPSVIGRTIRLYRDGGLVLVEQELHQHIFRITFPIEHHLDIGGHGNDLIDGDVLVQILDVGCSTHGLF